MNSIRIPAGFLLTFALCGFAGVALAATSPIEPCSIEKLTKTLTEKIAEGQGEHLSSKSWWNRCPKDIRKAVWESFTLKPKDDGRAAWQEPKGSPLPVIRTAPEIADTGQWFNTPPLTMSMLRGKVVLIHFWTLGCINCIHTLKSVEGYQQKYSDRAFTVIGVHSPEFAYEKSIQNLQNAIAKYGLTYPVVTDNDFLTWNAYGNQYWPAIYLIDAQGRVRYTHFGEGAYKETDDAIAELLNEIR